MVAQCEARVVRGVVGVMCRGGAASGCVLPLKPQATPQPSARKCGTYGVLRVTRDVMRAVSTTRVIEE